MMEVKGGPEGDIAFSSGMSLNPVLSAHPMQLRCHRPPSTCLHVRLHDLHVYHALPPKILNLMH